MNRMLSAKAITADKLDVNELSAITANVGHLKGGTIEGTTIKGVNVVGSKIQNDSGSFTVDENGNVTGVTIKGGVIDGKSVKINGYEVSACKIIRGTVYNGREIPIPEGYSEEQCVWGLMEYADSTRSIYRLAGRKVTAQRYKGGGGGGLVGSSVGYWLLAIK